MTKTLRRLRQQDKPQLPNNSKQIEPDKMLKLKPLKKQSMINKPRMQPIPRLHMTKRWLPRVQLSPRRRQHLFKKLNSR
jgi:hypothetical protein